MANRLTSSEKKELRDAGKEVPPTPEPPTESDEDEDDQDEVKSRTALEEGKDKGKEIADAEEVAGSSKKDKVVEPNQDDEHVKVTSSEIFGGCESIAKV